MTPDQPSAPKRTRRGSTPAAEPVSRSTGASGVLSGAPLGAVVAATLLALLLPAGVAQAAVPVPDLQGLSAAEAVAALQAARLDVGEVSEVPSLVVPAGRVTRQHPAAGVLVLPGSEVDLDLAASVDSASATRVPPSWVGRWLFTVSYGDPATGSLSEVDASETAICPGDALGLALIEDIVDRDEGDPRRGRRPRSREKDGDENSGPRLSANSHCSARNSDTVLDLFCRVGLVLDAGCTVDMLVTLAGERRGDRLTASGGWSTLALGTCGALPPGGETLAVTGARLDRDPGSCDAPRPSLTQQLVRHPNLLLLGLGEAEDGRDDDDED